MDEVIRARQNIESLMYYDGILIFGMVRISRSAHNEHANSADTLALPSSATTATDTLQS